MFNAPRRMGGNLSSSAFLASSTSNNSFDPLASSMPTPGGGFGEVDPWSSAPSPARTATPRRDSEEIAPVVSNGRISGDVLNALLDDPPTMYLSLLDSLEPPPSGLVPLSSVHRLLNSSRLPASTIERIITLTAKDASSLSRKEFFCALAMIALAQSTGEVSLEALSTNLPNLPLPQLTAPVTRSYSPETPSSPWETPRFKGQNGHPNFSQETNEPQSPSGAFDAEAEKGYWKKLEKVEVSLVAQKEGWFLQKYTVESDKRSNGPVSRRYSDFVWLMDCLVKRYPFRLLPTLPPKRIGPDASFLEQRRKGLQRFLNMVVNHPVTRDDGALNVFLSEPAFEAWRKRTKVSTDEESASKRLTPAQEMAIPADLDEKLRVLREHLPALLASYSKLVVLAERSLARLLAASADASRIALSLGTIAEEVPRCCYRGDCSLCSGVGRGLSEIGESWSRVAEESERRAATVLLGSIESLKTQRDLYVAFRDLFDRHDSVARSWMKLTAGLSKDTVDALRKKVEGRAKKIETLRSAKKAGWDAEVDKQVAANDQDSSVIASFLSRRVFVRACMWHELALVFHSRQAAQVTIGWRQWAKEAAEADKAVGLVWEELSERLHSMPLE